MFFRQSAGLQKSSLTKTGPLWLCVAVGLIVLTLLPGCLSPKPGSSATMAAAWHTGLENYKARLEARLTKGVWYDFDTAGAALYGTVVYQGTEITAAGKAIWPDDPAYRAEALAEDSFRSPVFLVGLCGPSFVPDDLLKSGRVRLELTVTTEDGRIRKLHPARLKHYPPGDKFIKDYYPVFSPWDQVFIVSFGPALPKGQTVRDLELALAWPGGVWAVPYPNALRPPALPQ